MLDLCDFFHHPSIKTPCILPTYPGGPRTSGRHLRAEKTVNESVFWKELGAGTVRRGSYPAENHQDLVRLLPPLGERGCPHPGWKVRFRRKTYSFCFPGALTTPLQIPQREQLLFCFYFFLLMQILSFLKVFFLMWTIFFKSLY